MQLGQPMQAEHPQWQKGSAHRFERNCWPRSSALRQGTQPPPCVCSESHPQETTAPTVAASTIWMWNTLQAWQGDAASWYPVKSLFRGLWAISHRIRGGVHPRHSFLPVPDHQLKELQREMACDPIVQFGKESNLGWLPRYNGWITSSHSPVLCFLK